MSPIHELLTSGDFDNFPIRQYSSTHDCDVRAYFDIHTFEIPVELKQGDMKSWLQLTLCDTFNTVIQLCDYL